jgi:hypothetical protein
MNYGKLERKKESCNFGSVSILGQFGVPQNFGHWNPEDASHIRFDKVCMFCLTRAILPAT